MDIFEPTITRKDYKITHLAMLVMEILATLSCINLVILTIGLLCGGSEYWFGNDRDFDFGLNAVLLLLAIFIIVNNEIIRYVLSKKEIIE